MIVNKDSTGKLKFKTGSVWILLLLVLLLFQTGSLAQTHVAPRRPTQGDNWRDVGGTMVLVGIGWGTVCGPCGVAIGGTGALLGYLGPQMQNPGDSGYSPLPGEMPDSNNPYGPLTWGNGGISGDTGQAGYGDAGGGGTAFSKQLTVRRPSAVQQLTSVGKALLPRPDWRSFALNTFEMNRPMRIAMPQSILRAPVVNDGQRRPIDHFDHPNVPAKLNPRPAFKPMFTH